MNDFGDLMRNAWQATRPPEDSAALIKRVRRHHLRHQLRRGLEIAITLAAVTILFQPLTGAAVGPSYWLLMPFFVVYLPAVWWLLLRSPRPQIDAVALDVHSFARVRLSQLRTGLRELRITRIAVLVLLGYAGSAAVGAFLLGDAAWQAAAAQLLVFALVWAGALTWLTYRRRRRVMAQYRVMRRLFARDARQVISNS